MTDTPPPTAPKQQIAMNRRLRRAVDPVGTLMSDVFHLIGLFVIGASTVWASVLAFLTMIQHGSAKLDDLLLLFIYLEIGAMVGIYFRTRHMPVRFLIYVAITALTRHMIVYVQHETTPDLGIIYMAGGTLILAVAVLIIRYASHHYPSRSGVEATEDG
jgi:protein PsiE